MAAMVKWLSHRVVVPALRVRSPLAAPAKIPTLRRCFCWWWSQRRSNKGMVRGVEPQQRNAIEAFRDGETGLPMCIVQIFRFEQSDAPARAIPFFPLLAGGDARQSLDCRATRGAEAPMESEATVRPRWPPQQKTSSSSGSFLLMMIIGVDRTLHPCLP